MRTIVALLAAIAGPTVVVVGVFVCFQAPGKGISLRELQFIALCASIVSAAYVLVLGFPAFLLLRWKRLVRWWSLTGSGFVLGALPPAVVMSLDSKLMAAGATGGVFGVLGAVGGLCFWLAWRQGAAASRAT